MTQDSFDEWTPDERAGLAEVGQHRSPRSELKARTMGTLRDQGLLGFTARTRPRRRLVFGLAAAIVVFAAGMLAGYGVGLRRQAATARDSVTNASAAPAREVARLDTPSTQPTAAGRHVVWF